ncbi:pseudouridine synthase [uncultured Alistipes sp.]|jgi:pseudouridylate synthase|uniref:pseudouridine synthase n=1 Tax=uncultured Alistipes sp. TaxID=538949 RepID=UPI0025F7C65E|nr:pseudouridine synthase [uncultured Alistipes sp.]
MRRLNKYITDAGYCSRREADTYITQGRVTINGQEAGLGDMVDDTDVVEVDGERVGRRKKLPVYIACHKPIGVTCTSERSDKTNIIDFLGYKERIFPIGRLDKDSEGLILLTNDGDIVNKILRAGNNNPKEYIVTVDKPVTPQFLERMAGGVRILGVTTKPCRIIKKKETSFVIYLTQGLNRQIRRMCQVLGYKVVKLKRVKVLNISLGSLEPGRWRYFTPEETREMHALLAKSSGTEEASDEKKAAKAKPRGKQNPQAGNLRTARTGAIRSIDGSTSSAHRKGGPHPGIGKLKTTSPKSATSPSPSIKKAAGSPSASPRRGAKSVPPVKTQKRSIPKKAR